MTGTARSARRALDAGLKAMFEALKARAVPDRIRSVADQLPGQTASEPAKGAARARSVGT